MKTQTSEIDNKVNPFIGKDGKYYTTHEALVNANKAYENSR